MIAAIAGDIIGSLYEFAPHKSVDFPLFDARSDFTDDTVLTIAIADVLLNDLEIVETLKKYTLDYPGRGYGGSYLKWSHSDSTEPYNSWGNGSAMRTSPVGFLYNDEEEVLRAAEACAKVTHNHPFGIQGAQATALSIFLARTGADKQQIRSEIEQRFHYDLSERIEDIRPPYQFDVSCQGSVPQSIIAFLESNSVEDTIRLAVSLGGDADTMACIAGGIAEAYYGKVPENIVEETRARLPEEFLTVIDAFYTRIKN